MELVYGSGDVFRTGSAAGPGSLQEQWSAGDAYKNPMGPGQNDFMRLVQGAQGTIGIVTWITAKCEIQPTIEELGMFGSNRLEDLIELTYAMLRKQLVDVCFIISKQGVSPLLSAVESERERILARSPEYMLVFSVAGLRYYPEQKVKNSWREIGRIGEGLGTTPQPEPPGVTFSELQELLLRPSSEPYWKLRPRGASREVFFLTTLNRVASFVALVEHRARAARVTPEQLALYVQPQLGGRLCHLEFVLYHDPNDHAETRRISEFADGAVGWLLEAGAFFSRPYGAHTKEVMANVSGFDLFKRVKGVFDPDGILAPGRLGLDTYEGPYRIGA